MTDVSTARRSDFVSTDTTLGRRRLLGIGLLFALLGGFFAVDGFPKLDAVREEIVIATGSEAVAAGPPSAQITNCFQGFCFEDGASRVDQWWEFASTFLELTIGGLLLALLAAAITDAFLFPTSRGPGFGRGFWRGGVRVADQAALADGSLIGNARSGTLGALQAATSLSAPALVAIFVMVSPVLGFTRLVAGLVGVLVLGMVAVPSSSPRSAVASSSTVDPWAVVFTRGARDTLTAFWRFSYRVIPLFVVAGLLGAYIPQLVTQDQVEALLGDHLLGIVLAALVGVLVTVPLMMEIPIVALLLLVDVGVVPVAVFLFASVATSPIALRDLMARAGSRLAWKQGVGVTGLGVAAGGFALVAITLFPVDQPPTVAFDGEVCTYSGPSRVAPLTTTFQLRNDAPPSDGGETLTVAVGLLSEGATVDQLAFDVRLDPRAPLPHYFVSAGEHAFVFPGSPLSAEYTFHTPGEYAAVCMYGGGFYVIREFSMVQPNTWFEEFRELYHGHVAEATFVVGG